LFRLDSAEHPSAVGIISRRKPLKRKLLNLYLTVLLASARASGSRQSRGLVEVLVILKDCHHEQGKVLVAREVALDDRVAHVPAPRMPAPWPPDCYQDRTFTGEQMIAFRTHHALVRQHLSQSANSSLKSLSDDGLLQPCVASWLRSFAGKLEKISNQIVVQ